MSLRPEAEEYTCSAFVVTLRKTNVQGRKNSVLLRPTAQLLLLRQCKCRIQCLRIPLQPRTFPRDANSRLVRRLRSDVLPPSRFDGGQHRSQVTHLKPREFTPLFVWADEGSLQMLRDEGIEQLLCMFVGRQISLYYYQSMAADRINVFTAFEVKQYGTA
ncbi:hypothetical protein B0H17DRAFT_1135548 [Mycena rosella]|uniref:Uncharacterized protein n=1 Tax=Mycena rosella TaxID=1033263 RepID=A0AAD7DDC2_MYCRO|nr:hypothetical protein B0H17DRAFT_1135548 [Mycena rosella]